MTDAEPAAGRLRVNERADDPAGRDQLRASRSSGPGGQHANVTASRVEASFDVRASRVAQRRPARAPAGPSPARAWWRSRRTSARRRATASWRCAAWPSGSRAALAVPSAAARRVRPRPRASGAWQRSAARARKRKRERRRPTERGRLVQQLLDVALVQATRAWSSRDENRSRSTAGRRRAPTR